MFGSVFGGKKKKKTKARAATSGGTKKGKSKAAYTKRASKSAPLDDDHSSAGDDDASVASRRSATKSVRPARLSKGKAKKAHAKPPAARAKKLAAPAPPPVTSTPGRSKAGPAFPASARGSDGGEGEGKADADPLAPRGRTSVTGVGSGGSSERLQAPVRDVREEGEAKGREAGRATKHVNRAKRPFASRTKADTNSTRPPSSGSSPRTPTDVSSRAARRSITTPRVAAARLATVARNSSARVIQTAWRHSAALRAQRGNVTPSSARSEEAQAAQVEEAYRQELAQGQAEEAVQMSVRAQLGEAVQEPTAQRRRPGREAATADFDGDPLFEWLKTVRLPDLLRPLHELGVHEPLDLTDLEPEHVHMLGLKPVRKSRFMRAVASLQTQAEGASAQAVDTAAAAAGATAIRPAELKLGKEIGTGSYGVVYSGRWRGTQVAVKILRASLSHAAMESAAAEIIRELNTMRRVGNHRHIVSLLGICHLQFPARLAIVTDYMARGSLLDVLKGKTGDPPTDIKIVQMAAQVAAGIAHLHRENVVHRDLAARNVLVDKHYNLRVGDFGFARVLSDPVDVGVTSSNVGPVRWMAPQCLRRRQYSTASDVWAFGVLLYEMVTRGREPWQGMGLMEVGSKVLSGETLEPLLPPYTDPELAAIMVECWRFEPDARPGMMELCNRLQEHHDRLVAGAAPRRAAPAVAREREAGAGEAQLRVPGPGEPGYDPFFTADRIPRMATNQANVAPGWGPTSGGAAAPPQHYTESLAPAGSSAPLSTQSATSAPGSLLSSGTLSRDSTDVASGGGGSGGGTSGGSGYAPMPAQQVTRSQLPQASYHPMPANQQQRYQPQNQQQQQQQQRLQPQLQKQQQYVPSTRLRTSPALSSARAPPSARASPFRRHTANMAAGPPAAPVAASNVAVEALRQARRMPATGAAPVAKSLATSPSTSVPTRRPRAIASSRRRVAKGGKF